MWHWLSQCLSPLPWITIFLYSQIAGCSWKHVYLPHSNISFFPRNSLPEHLFLTSKYSRYRCCTTKSSKRFICPQFKHSTRSKHRSSKLFTPRMRTSSLELLEAERLSVLNFHFYSCGVNVNNLEWSAQKMILLVCLWRRIHISLKSTKEQHRALEVGWHSWTSLILILTNLNALITLITHLCQNSSGNWPLFCSFLTLVWL